MGRSCLLLFRMDDSCRLLPDITIYEKSYSQKDERYAQPLSHIQHHILLESHLRFFDELYQEAHSEASYKECSDEESSVKPVKPVPVHEYLEYSEKEIAERFI